MHRTTCPTANGYDVLVIEVVVVASGNSLT
jgi:hypothetical protein